MLTVSPLGLNFLPRLKSNMQNPMIMKRIALFLTALTVCFPSMARLTDGEVVSYTLSLGFIKGGEASLITKKTSYQGREAYEVSLIVSTTKAVDKLFSIRDTLTTTVTPDIEPLFFKKHCFENDDIVFETAEFSRSGDGGYRGRLMKRYKEGDEKKLDTICSRPIYDMVSLVLYARNIDLENAVEGQRFQFSMADAAVVENENLIYMGRDRVKVAGGQRECHVFSLVQPYVDKGKSREKELIRIYVSDDGERIPVQMDINLPVSKAKAKMR